MSFGGEEGGGEGRERRAFSSSNLYSIINHKGLWVKTKGHRAGRGQPDPLFLSHDHRIRVIVRKKWTKKSFGPSKIRIPGCLYALEDSSRYIGQGCPTFS